MTMRMKSKRSRVPLMVGAALVGAMLSLSAFAGKSDPASVDGRLDALSVQADQLGANILSMQQNLLGSSAAPVQSQRIRVGQSREVGQINVRLDQIENQMRVLNGQVEGLQFQLTQMQTLIERMQEDYEFRFQEQEGGSLGKTSAAPQPDSVTLSEGLPQTQTEATTADTQTLGAPETTLGTIVLEESGQPLDLSFNPGTTLSEADGDAQYEAGYEAIVRGDYLFAKDQFSQFVALYPKHPQSADAYHWLGEALMQNGENEEAAEVFLAGYESFPNAARAPDMVLKLGIVLANTGERETACRTFIEVLRKYPNQAKAFTARVKEEQRKSQC
ncbi:tol-pal system protein YbgF [Maritalea porphyrae]|uniref:tol-pal system protein YbgF n=1 Tax=Maritalea porphyrae TaxID=880732 RepID=UPI0022AED272|nr:tol-pal system protein YbgF [Maritalea porphyrae]MCZ4273665.1 tol-pal system protein YbgF [Maritalea porphyrae]